MGRHAATVGCLTRNDGSNVGAIIVGLGLDCVVHICCSREKIGHVIDHGHDGDASQVVVVVIMKCLVVMMIVLVVLADHCERVLTRNGH